MMIHATRAERLEKNMEVKRRKEMNLVLEKERLVKEIKKVDGLWCSKDAAAENYLKKLKTEKEKKSLKFQLGFRQKVLGADCDKSQVKVLRRCQIRCCVIWYRLFLLRVQIILVKCKTTLC